MHVYLCSLYVWCSQRPVKDIRFPGVRITDGDGVADCFHYWPVVCEGGLYFGRGHVLSERWETVFWLGSVQWGTCRKKGLLGRVGQA